MNIFITGDTHGDLSRITEMYDAITSDTPIKGIPHVDKFDYLIHCGDYKKDGFELGKKLGLPVIAVFGNCDDVWDPDFDILDTEAGSIVATHGHIEDINNTHENLYALAEDQGCNCICYGHSHIAVYGEENGYLVINPGSPTKPLDGTMGSCAILKADENGYAGNLIWYADVLKAKEAAAEEQAPAEPEEQPAEAPVEEPVEEPAPAEAEPEEQSPVEEPAEEPAPAEAEPPAEPEEQPAPAEEPAEEPEVQQPAEKPAPKNEKPADKPAKKKTGGLGGFLRKIFNYSDGQ